MIKKNTFDFIKINNFCSLNDTIEKREMSGNGMRENVCSTYIGQKICASRTYK